MKLKSVAAKFLTNKWVLNIIAFLSLLNIIGYLVIGNLNAVLFFILLAVLVRYFSKNMIIVLGVPLVLVNLLITRITMMEGMETQKDNSTTADKSKMDKSKMDKSSTNPDKKIIKQINDQASKRHGSLVTTPLEKHESEDTSGDMTDDTTGETDGFEPGRKKNAGYDIDYATTVENAYDDLNNILGSDGIQRLTSDTQSLFKQQQQLADAMKSMGPLIQGMAPMMKSVNEMMSSMGGDDKNGLGGVMEMAKKLAGKAQGAPAK